MKVKFAIEKELIMLLGETLNYLLLIVNKLPCRPYLNHFTAKPVPNECIYYFFIARVMRISGLLITTQYYYCKYNCYRNIIA